MPSVPARSFTEEVEFAVVRSSSNEEEASASAGPSSATADGDPLRLVQTLCDELERHHILYCHFKSNNELARSAAGLNDLDLLVAARDGPRFGELVSALGFKHARSRFRVPGVEHWYGLDEDTGVLVHLHVHLRLVIGDDTTKNYRIPIEDAYLASTTRDGLFRIPSPELELALFATRMILKHAPWDVGIGPRSFLSGREREEMDSLLDRIGPGNAADILASAVSMVDAKTWGSYLRVLGGDCSPLFRARVAYDLQRRLATSARHNQLMDSALKLWRRRWRRVRRRLVGESGKALDRGSVIAIVGGDGAGKTSAVEELRAWLRPFETLAVHLGKPPRSATTIAVRGALGVYRRSGLGRLRRGPGLATESLEPRGDARLVANVLLARDRYRLSRRARRFADRPGVVIADRYPLPGIESMDAARSSRILVGSDTTKLARWLAEREQRYYRGIVPPDVLVVLRVRPEIAVDRKPDEDPSDVRDRNAEIWRARWKENAYVLDAGRAREHVISELKKAVWSSL